jgi:hypothetical protein
MARNGIFLVLSRPASPEQEAEYNAWYNDHHIPDALLLPGFRSGRRFKLADEQLMPVRATEPGFNYVALYEVDDLDQIPRAAQLMPKLASVSRAEHFISPAMDSANMRAFVFEEIFECAEPSPLPDGLSSLDG